MVGDLDAYVCLFEECESPKELYSHSSQWLKHTREHSLRWRCTSKIHEAFVVTSREEYIEHMKAVHRSRLTDAQLRLLADRSSRSVGPIFESCPLCGIEEPRCGMEEHVVGHLRLLAIKSLPPYDAEESEGPENADTMASTMRTRSTIRDFTDSHMSFTASSGSISIRDEPDNPDHLGTHFWALSGSSSGSGQSYRGSAQGSVSGDLVPRQLPMPKTRMEPRCAFCHLPAPLTCDCEAKNQETDTRRAEAKMLQTSYNEVRDWVRRHAKNQVSTRFRIAASQIEGDRLRALDELEHGVDEASGDTSETADAALKRKINQLWCEAVQTYPSSLDHFYSLADFSVPSDDDPAVRDPPLGDPVYPEHHTLYEDLYSRYLSSTPSERRAEGKPTGRESTVVEGDMEETVADDDSRLQADSRTPQVQ